MACVFPKDFQCKQFENDPLCKSEFSCKESTECYHDSVDVASLATDLDSCVEFGDCKFESLKIHELQLAFEKNMQIKVASELVSDKDFISTENEMPRLDSKSYHEELKFLEVNDLTTTTKGLEKSSTFPCKEEKIGSSSVSIDIQPIFVSTDSDEKQVDDSCFEQATQLPSATKLVSSMKGGRVKEGYPSNLKLSVKWAADVYDPPITLMSHTVSNHQHRPKPKKKDRNKHNKHKGRSSRGSADKKNVIRNITRDEEPVHLRLQSSADKTVSDGYKQSGLEEILDYAVAGKESKCGSSFLAGSLTKVQNPVTEAS